MNQLKDGIEKLVYGIYTIGRNDAILKNDDWKTLKPGVIKKAYSILESEMLSIIPKKRELPLYEPSLRQGAGGDSAPFFCELCGMSEMDLMERKEDDRYYCHCSYWSDPHNAYLDRSGGKWLGWFDKDEARRVVDSLPVEENGYNQALDDIRNALKGRLSNG